MWSLDNRVLRKIMKVSTHSKGFTLIEVLIIFAIIGILAAIAIFSYHYAIETARRTSAVSALSTIRTEMAAYNVDKGSYPLSVNFTNFTDQNGTPILTAVNWGRIKDKVYSWDSYMPGSDTYTLMARAWDSNHTVLTLTPRGVAY